MDRQASKERKKLSDQLDARKEAALKALHIYIPADIQTYITDIHTYLHTSTFTRRHTYTHTYITHDTTHIQHSTHTYDNNTQTNKAQQ